jgi:phosphopantetheine--protein transferase-like protein
MSELPLNKDSDTEPIAIVGMSCSDARSSTLAAYWNAIVSGCESKPGTRSTDREHVSLVRKICDALLDANIKQKLPKSVKARIIACQDSLSEFGKISWRALLEEQFRDGDLEMSEFFSSALGSMREEAISSFIAIELAMQCLRSRESDLVVVFASNAYDKELHSKSDNDSTAVLVFERLADALSDGDRLYGCINKVWHSQEASVIAAGDESESHSPALRNPCINSVIENGRAFDYLEDMIKAALALYHRVLPPSVSVGHFSYLPFPEYLQSFSNLQIRPWIHARPHPELVLIKPASDASSVPRRALITELGRDRERSAVVIEESSDDYFSSHPTYFGPAETELFIFEEDDSTSLGKRLEQVQGFLQTNTQYSLKDIAYSLNCVVQNATTKQSRIAAVRMAIVARTAEELSFNLMSALDFLRGEVSDADKEKLRERGIYAASANDSIIQSGKMAFLLPGLGSAYPHMLSDLCIHFPEVRLIFDFVDYLASDSGSEELPSEKIFPKPDENGNATSNALASLVGMDAAVVTVLMAEWALFTLFLKLEIVPDILVGCSTGEFAALTMSGAANILTSAPLFYHLSTKVANSLPKDKLAELRTIKVKAPIEKFAYILERDQTKVYLSADLSDQQVIMTGDRNPIAVLVNTLESLGIEVDYLPVAIPYHTALVHGAVAADTAELENLEMHTPDIAAWSCSIASEYPNDVTRLKAITTELFSQPILFKKTIRRLYETGGVTKFLEVGPKDTLTPIIGEILVDSPHIAVASNRAAGSGVSHLNHALARLHADGVSMNLDYLYGRRMPNECDFKVDQVREKETSSQTPFGLYSSSSRTEEPTYSSYVPQGLDAGDSKSKFSRSDVVVKSFLETVAQFHQNLMEKEATIMAAYLEQREDRQSPPSTGQFKTVENFALLKDARISPEGDDLSLDVPLTLNWHQYLLDHAIGGEVRTRQGLPDAKERVYLMPLTVALEMMAEVASLWYPGARIVEISHIRAFKRIRVGEEGQTIRLLVRASAEESSGAAVTIQKVEGEGESAGGNPEILMSCQVIFDTVPRALVPYTLSFIKDWKPSKFKNLPLYGKSSMFHGPRMQSVRSIEGVSDGYICGSLEAKKADDWFPLSAGEPNFLIDPLMLDNATQLVLYHLLEHEEPVDALLPFMVDSLQFQAVPITVREKVAVQVQFNSLTSRGTDASIQICSSDGKPIAQFNSIKSRRIVLNDKWREYVHAPAENFLSQPATVVAKTFVDTAQQIYRCMDESALPSEEATLSWCADYILTAAETKMFESLANSKRRREWLLGRICVKDAVRLLLARSADVHLGCADVEILYHASGAPQVLFPASLHSVPKLSISIAHKGGLAMAVASNDRSKDSIGIDIERVERRDSGIETLILTERECSILVEELKRNRDLVLSTAWAAKEAASKALGIGLEGNPKNLEIVAIERSGERQKLTLRSNIVTMPTLIVSAETAELHVFTECKLSGTLR